MTKARKNNQKFLKKKRHCRFSSNNNSNYNISTNLASSQEMINNNIIIEQKSMINNMNYAEDIFNEGNNIFSNSLSSPPCINQEYFNLFSEDDEKPSLSNNNENSFNNQLDYPNNLTSDNQDMEKISNINDEVINPKDFNITFNNNIANTSENSDEKIINYNQKLGGDESKSNLCSQIERIINSNKNDDEQINKAVKKPIFLIIKNSKKYDFSPFNYDEFRKNYDLIYKNKIENTDEPPFVSIEEIKEIELIKQLWTIQNAIFNSEIDFNNTLEKGDIYRYLFSFLNGKDYKKPKDRAHQPDEMSQRFKSFIIEEAINSTNDFKEFKLLKLDKIDKNKIYVPIKRDFQLCLLERKIYSIISNDINNFHSKYNYEIIQKILMENREQGNYTILVEHLNLTFKDCLNIIIYKKEDTNNKFQKKLIEFLYRTYDEIEYDEKTKKDYISAMLLLTYNYERIFFLKIPRGFRKNNKSKSI